MMGAARAGLWHSPGAIAGLLLDGLSVTVRGAWGMRKLRAAYAGSCIRVRRNSDNAEQDIGFTSGGDLDTSALLTFVGSGSGYVSKWYDQSSVGADFIQATASLQCRAAISGSAVTSGNTANKPAIQLLNNENTTFLGVSSFTLGSSTTFSAHGVLTTGPSSMINGAARFLSFTGSGDDADYASNKSAIPMLAFGSTTMSGFMGGGLSSVSTAGNSLFQLSSIYDGSNQTMLADSSAGTPTAYSGAFASPGVLQLGTRSSNINSNEQWAGIASELIMTSGTLSSADQAAIRAGQKTYYGTA